MNKVEKERGREWEGNGKGKEERHALVDPLLCIEPLDPMHRSV